MSKQTSSRTRGNSNELVELLYTQDEPEQYAAYCKARIADYQPLNDGERDLLRIVVDCDWWLLRVFAVQNFSSETAAQAFNESDMQLLELHMRQLERLHKEERRLERVRKDTLKQIDAQRLPSALGGTRLLSARGASAFSFLPDPHPSVLPTWARQHFMHMLPEQPPAPESEPIVLATYQPDKYVYCHR